VRYTLGTDTTVASRSTSRLLQSRVCYFLKYTPTKAEIEYPYPPLTASLQGSKAPRSRSGAARPHPWSLVLAGVPGLACGGRGSSWIGVWRPVSAQKLASGTATFDQPPALKMSNFSRREKTFWLKWVKGQKGWLVSGGSLASFAKVFEGG
jgi:hypothetical protein